MDKSAPRWQPSPSSPAQAAVARYLRKRGDQVPRRRKFLTRLRRLKQAEESESPLVLPTRQPFAHGQMEDDDDDESEAEGEEEDDEDDAHSYTSPSLDPVSSANALARVQAVTSGG